MTISVERRADKQRADGRAQLRLRVTHDGKQRYHPLGIYVTGKEWDASRARMRGRDQRAADTNARLAQAEQAAADVIAQLHREGLPLTAAAVRDAAAAQLSVKDEAEQADFITYARAFNEGYRLRGQFRTWKRVNAVLNKLEPFLKKHAGTPRRAPVAARGVPFETVTTRLLREWADHLMTNSQEGGHGNSESTAHNNVKAVGTICEAAIREEVAPAAWRNPTKQIKLRARPASKERLSRAELGRLASLGSSDGLGDGTRYTPGLQSTEGDLLALVRDVFLFSVYMAGVRFGDCCELRIASVREVDGKRRLAYRMGKTQEEHALIIPPPALSIAERYIEARAPLPTERTGGRLFGLLDGRTKADGTWYSARHRVNAISSANTLANKQLKRLARLAEIHRGGEPMKLSTHIARHSWADLARKSDWQITDIQQALGHSSPAITQRYLEAFDQDRLDEKMRSLF